MKFLPAAVLILSLLVVACGPHQLTDDEISEFTSECRRSDSIEITDLHFKGFGYDFDTITMQGVSNGEVVSTLQLPFSKFNKISDGREMDFNYYSTLDINKTYAYHFYLNDSIPYILSDIEMKADQRSFTAPWNDEETQFMICTVKQYRMDGELFQSHNITFVKRNSANDIN